MAAQTPPTTDPAATTVATGGTTEPAFAAFIPESTDPDSLLEAFLAACEARGLDLYDAQEEAILEIFADRHVILNTPTGSGKSLVASAMHFAAIARGETSWYTAPVKALVNEKFFDLCTEFGAENVGLVTGDASVNADAPVICATAEILANLALREGADAPVSRVSMDEFHFYADPDRGWAWQAPLLELDRAQFLLMSATLGNTAYFAEDLEARTGRDVAEVVSVERPVPLDYTYRETPLHESLEAILDANLVPVYVVYFTQKTATAAAQAFCSLPLVDKAEKAEIRSVVDAADFGTPFGKDLRRMLGHGVGIHHAGMLPRYRRLVEQLAQTGLLKVICGTDTLGVGVNVPIRTVLITQLCKFDGTETRILTRREFHQIAGRAGRKGHDDAGSVWVQAPEHVAENKKALARAGSDAKKQRKVVRKKAPKFGFVAWNEDTFNKLVHGAPERLEPQLKITHTLLLQMLDRPGDGCAALKRLLTDNHEARTEQRHLIKRAIRMYRSLVASGIVERLDTPDDLGRFVRVHIDLQSDFALNQPLSPFALEAIDVLGPVPEGDNDLAESHADDVVSVIEATLEDPRVVLRAQLAKIKDQAVAEMKAEGVEYDERMAVLDELSWPKPLDEFLSAGFAGFCRAHPWALDEELHPKSVVRDLWTQGWTFNEYVSYYGLRGSEGVLLRYLSDAYKALVQTIPEDAKTDDIYDICDWLGALVRGVDASLVDEWESLRAGDSGQDIAEGARGRDTADKPFDITKNKKAFGILVRNEVFSWVRALSLRNYGELAESLAGGADDADRSETWTPARLAAALDPYWAEYDEIATDGNARGPAMFDLATSGAQWRVTQILADPAGDLEWRIEAHADLRASREVARAVVVLDEIVRL